ncbi:PACE efflux transporter [Thalassovita sp.]|uniref:PACE efflux transporter n=1 Tax=Thalassovita sp. TaxID=1979401 RepID=UPI0029DE72DC|nr:PACE efflux transporter [Thalassovita sp.]
MRTTLDRIRHAILFELIALLIVAPSGGLLFGVSTTHFGLVAIVSTTLAMLWNYAYNLGFDHALRRLGLSLRKTLKTRIVHAILFEIGLSCLLVPFIAWYLDVSLWEALIMDIAVAGFYLLFAFAFNWAYDGVFPLPADEPQTSLDADAV